MHHLEFQVRSSPLAWPDGPGWALSGVVGSGNLEVLVERGADPTAAKINVATSVAGYDEVWRRVLSDFAAASWAVGGTSVTINDMGAVPAVVKIRLRQAFAQLDRTGHHG